MTGKVHRIRIRLSGWQKAPTASQLQNIADQINARAQGRRMLGIVSGAGDGKTRLANASHVVLPTARVRGSLIVVEIETTDTAVGRTVQALISAKVPVVGSLRAIMSDFEDIRVITVDVELFDGHSEETVLDDIVDALDID